MSLEHFMTTLLFKGDERSLDHVSRKIKWSFHNSRKQRCNENHGSRRINQLFLDSHPGRRFFSLSLGELVPDAFDQRWFLIHHSSHLQ